MQVCKKRMLHLQISVVDVLAPQRLERKTHGINYVSIFKPRQRTTYVPLISNISPSQFEKIIVQRSSHPAQGPRRQF